MGGNDNADSEAMNCGRSNASCLTPGRTTLSSTSWNSWRTQAISGFCLNGQAIPCLPKTSRQSAPLAAEFDLRPRQNTLLEEFPPRGHCSGHCACPGFSPRQTLRRCRHDRRDGRTRFPTRRFEWSLWLGADTVDRSHAKLSVDGRRKGRGPTRSKRIGERSAT